MIVSGAVCTRILYGGLFPVQDITFPFFNRWSIGSETSLLVVHITFEN